MPRSTVVCGNTKMVRWWGIVVGSSKRSNLTHNTWFELKETMHFCTAPINPCWLMFALWEYWMDFVRFVPFMVQLSCDIIFNRCASHDLMPEWKKNHWRFINSQNETVLTVLIRAFFSLRKPHLLIITSHANSLVPSSHRINFQCIFTSFFWLPLIFYLPMENIQCRTKSVFPRININHFWMKTDASFL